MSGFSMKLKNVLKIIFGLLFLIMLVIIVWVLFTSMVKVFGDYTSSVEPTIVVAIISGLVAIIVNAISKGMERNNSLIMKKGEKLASEYVKFLSAISSAKTDEAFRETCAKYEFAFAVNSSDDVYHEFLKLKASKLPVDTTPFIDLIRKELKVSKKTSYVSKKDEPTQRGAKDHPCEINEG